MKGIVLNQKSIISLINLRNSCNKEISMESLSDDSVSLDNKSMKVIGLTIGLFIGIELANRKGEPDYQNELLPEIKQTISVINETLVFDVKYALDFTEKIYKTISYIMNNPVGLVKGKDNLFSSMFDKGTIDEEYQELFKENAEIILESYGTISTNFKYKED